MLEMHTRKQRHYVVLLLASQKKKKSEKIGFLLLVKKKISALHLGVTGELQTPVTGGIIVFFVCFFFPIVVKHWVLSFHPPMSSDTRKIQQMNQTWASLYFCPVLHGGVKGFQNTVFFPFSFVWCWRFMSKRALQIFFFSICVTVASALGNEMLFFPQRS